VEYKKEGLRAFRNLETTLNNELIIFLENIDGFFAAQEAQRTQDFVQVIPESVSKQQDTIAGASKVGRNDPCPCGSGKKVKKCDCKEYESLRK
jgi:preprotein translocase subunit SecA